MRLAGCVVAAFLMVGFAATAEAAEPTDANSSPSAASAGDTPVISFGKPPAGWTAPAPMNSHAVTEDDYPSASVVSGEEGRTILKYLVRADGTVGAIVVEAPSGSARLDTAAQAVVKRWVFKPATHDGKPAPVWMKAVVVFRLHDYFNYMTNAPGAPFNVIDPDRMDYPLESIAAGEDGTTVLMVIVTKGGTVGTVAIIGASGHPRLDQAAVSLVTTKWHAQPAVLNGKPVQTMLMLVIRWKKQP